jgi:photosystem II stability/assembly factor-like uncharacterized protein
MSCGAIFKSTNGGEVWKAMNSGLPPIDMTGGAAFSGAHVLAIDPQTHVVYVVNLRCVVSASLSQTCDSRVFKSTEGGEIWTEPGSAPIAGYIVQSLAIDPQNAGTLYAQVVRSMGATLRNEILKSNDGGSSWTATNIALPSGCCFRDLKIDPQNPNTIYTAGFGIFKSTDGGASSSAVYPAPTYFSALAIDPQQPSMIYATGYGIFKSRDGGENWTAANSGLRAASIFSVAMDSQNPGTLYVGTTGSCCSEDYGGVYKTTNGGASWRAANSG